MALNDSDDDDHDDSAEIVDDVQDASDDAECELPVENMTPAKKQRIDLSDCFTSLSTASSTPPTICNKVYDTMCSHISLSEILGMGDTLDSGEHGASTSCPVGGFLILDEVKDWHPNRLWASLWNNILARSFPIRTLRLRRKGCDWRRYLNSFVADQHTPTLCPWWSEQRRRGRDVLNSILARLTGQQVRIVKSVGKQMWAQASPTDQYRWYALSCGLKEPALARRVGSYSGIGKGRVTGGEVNQEPEAGATSPVPTYEACTGLMVTYNIGLGLKSPQVMSMVQEKATPQDFMTFFKESTFHKQCFDCFWEFLSQLGEKLRFRTIGACMELSENAESPGRVHLHAYLGTGIKGGTGSMCSIVRADIIASDLEYQGVAPFVRPTKPKKNHPKTVFDAAVNGLYYVIANKTSTIMRKATLWHITESRDCIGRTVTKGCVYKMESESLLPT